jgi:hypothetical protein
LKFTQNPEWKRGKDDTGERRLAWFNALNREAMQRGCRLISTPAASEVYLECLPGSAWPGELRQRGFPLVAEPDGQRILPYDVAVPMVQNADGTLGPLTPGSTKAVSMVKREPGIARVERYRFKAPF